MPVNPVTASWELLLQCGHQFCKFVKVNVLLQKLVVQMKEPVPLLPVGLGPFLLGFAFGLGFDIGSVVGNSGEGSLPVHMTLSDKGTGLFLRQLFVASS